MTTGPILWLVLTPLAILKDLLSIIILCHYRCHFHGTDVVLISILICLVLNCLVIPLSPALLELTESDWNEHLCNFFVWTALTTRMVKVSNLALLSFHWSKILRTSTTRSKVSTTTIVKIVIPILWVVAVVVGLLPVIGAVPDNFKTEKHCLFLLSDLGLGFVIFMIVFILAMTCISFVCSFDSLALVHYAKKIAFIKYGAGRFYLPRKNDGLSEHYTVHERYGQMNFAADLCRLVTIVTCFSLIFNHIPYVVIEFLYMSIGTDRGLSEKVVTWLSLIEALVLPYFLWFGSRRYKHAICYIFKVHILRRKHDSEENPDSCTLQSFTRKIKDVQTLPRTIHVPNNLSPSERTSRSSSTRGHHGGSPMDFNIQSKTKAKNDYFSKVNVDVHSNGGSLDSRDMRQIQRSGSLGSRNEQLRKKNLPFIFISDTVDHNSPKRLNVEPQKTVLTVRTLSDTETASVHSMYYMSSDYHPDCLNTDSLPRSVGKGHKKSSSNPTTITDGRIYVDSCGFNSLPRLHGEPGGIYSGSLGSIPRKKPPKMGLRSNSGSSPSLHQSHSRSSSGNIYILGHSRSASGTIFKSSNTTIPYICEIQAGRDGMVPRQLSEHNDSEGIVGQYSESDIDNVLENSSVHSEELQSKPVEIHSVTFIERPQIFPGPGHTSRQSMRQNGKLYPHQKDNEQVSDENDSGCMANCADEQYECNLNTHEQSNSTATMVSVVTDLDADLDGFTTSELLSSKPYSYLSSTLNSVQNRDFSSPWINTELSECGPNFFDREKSVEYAFFNNQVISSDSTGISASPKFDENTDRGFEEALNASYNSRESLCSCNGAYVESVSECTDMGEFFETHQCDDGSKFKTQAVISRISPASFTDPFCEPEDSAFIKSKATENDRKDDDSIDSSPWPVSTKTSKAVDFSFESDFSNERQGPEDGGLYQDIEAVYF